MTLNGWLQILFFSLCVLLVAKPLGVYLVRVYDGSVRWLAPVERFIYRVSGVDPAEDQHWTRYAGAMLLFSLASMLLTYLALRLQHLLPLNPQHFAAVPDRQAFETSASFTTNTNWQSYVGETMMSYFSQMTQLAFHNFASAAVGMALRGGPGAGHRAALGGPDRQLLGRPGARHPVRAAPALPGAGAGARAAGRDPEFQALSRGHHPGGRQADHRDGSGGEPGERSSSSAPTAAASSTPTPRIPSRTRRRGPTSGRSSRSS